MGVGAKVMWHLRGAIVILFTCKKTMKLLRSYKKVATKLDPFVDSFIPQTGLPLGFLLSLKESAGLARAAGFPMTGGWFPRLR